MEYHEALGIVLVHALWMDAFGDGYEEVKVLLHLVHHLVFAEVAGLLLVVDVQVEDSSNGLCSRGYAFMSDGHEDAGDDA